MNRLIIVGASGHGKVIADIARKNGYTEISFLDDNPLCKNCGEYAVIGRCEEADRYRDSDFIVAIGNSKIRRKIQTSLMEKNLHVVTLIHPDAVIADSAKIGVGSVVSAGAVINPYATLGEGCIVNTCSSVDHDCWIGDYVHISVGAHIAGTVTIGNNTWICAGVTVSNNIDITADCTIGAGAVVIQNIESSGTYVGVPAKKQK